MNDTEPTTPTEAIVRIFEGKLHRAQRGHGKTFIDGPPLPPPEPVRRPARVVADGDADSVVAQLIIDRCRELSELVTCYRLALHPDAARRAGPDDDPF